MPLGNVIRPALLAGSAILATAGIPALAEGYAPYLAFQLCGRISGRPGISTAVAMP